MEDAKREQRQMGLEFWQGLAAALVELQKRLLLEINNGLDEDLVDYSMVIHFMKFHRDVLFMSCLIDILESLSLI